MDRLDQVSLEHVRLRGAGVDPAVARLRLSSALASSTLHPPAMPPSAILIVRGMADPLPGRIGALQPSAIANRAWEQAARNRLGELYGRAARPAWGAVPSSAEAVLFGDYGELLACLAMELTSSGSYSWWWRAIVRNFSLTTPASRTDGWLPIWEEHPRYIPSALEHLADRIQSGKVLDSIAPAQAWRLLGAMIRAFDLPASIVTGSSLSSSPPPASHPGDQESTLPAGDPREPASSVRPTRFPWEPYVPGEFTPVTLGIEKRALLGLGLLLRRSPQIAFSTAFSQHFRTWLAAQNCRRFGSSTKWSAEAAAPPLDSTPDSRRVPHAEAESPRRLMPKPGPLTTASAPTAEPPPKSAISSPAESQVSPTAWNAGRFTQAGGVLYLIHVLRKMDLLRSFDTGLSGWALLELLARCLLGTSFEAIAGDPIWAALAELDERAPALPPGLGFASQETYAVPESWLAGLAPQPLSVRFRSRGMELWRPEDFLVLDSRHPHPAPGFPLLRTTHADRRRRRAAVGVHPLNLPLSSELRRFLHFVLPFARRRLGNVLQGMTLQQACLRQGKLILSRSHVDLVMGMRQISVPVRLAGLDANPGWVPELGRVITFHFLAEGYE